MAILKDDEYIIGSSSGKPYATTIYRPKVTIDPKTGKENVWTQNYIMPSYGYSPQTGGMVNLKTGQGGGSGTSEVKTDYTAYNAELLRKYNQTLASSELNKSQLAENYRNAISQYQTQEGDVNANATNLGQQAYLSRKQAERVNPNVLESQGLANTGYKKIAQQKIGTAYQASYANIVANQQQQLNSINQNRANTTTAYNQNLASLELARKQAYEDYLASRK